MKRILTTALTIVALSGVGMQSAQAASNHKSFDYYSARSSVVLTQDFTTGGTDRRIDVEAYGHVANRPSQPKNFQLKLWSYATGMQAGVTKSCSGDCHVNWGKIPKGKYFMSQTISKKVSGQKYELGGTVLYGVK